MQTAAHVQGIGGQYDIRIPFPERLLSQTALQIQHPKAHKRVALRKIPLKMAFEPGGDIGKKIINFRRERFEGSRHKSSRAASSRSYLDNPNFLFRILVEPAGHRLLHAESDQPIEVVGQRSTAIDVFHQAQRSTWKHHVGSRSRTTQHIRQRGGAGRHQLSVSAKSWIFALKICFDRRAIRVTAIFESWSQLPGAALLEQTIRILQKTENR